jgi:stage II sporulation protein D
MIRIEKEPVIRVGLAANAGAIHVRLKGAFESADGERLNSGDYIIEPHNNGLRLAGPLGSADRNDSTTPVAGRIRLSPVNLADCTFTVEGVTIGVDFHWERQETQSFQGSIEAVRAEDGVRIINEIPVECYLASVISSEMSASCPGALLRAHAIVSRSWLLAQLTNNASPAPGPGTSEAGDRLIRWYDRESHKDFDVCADDHCQRYQGITKAFGTAAFDAVRETRGEMLVYADNICDARYSKCCGGMTERYSAAWDDINVPYLSPVYDGGGRLAPDCLPLTTEANAERWIRSSPQAFCNTRSEELFSRILTGFDQETVDFYRWEIVHDSQDLTDILNEKLGIDFGRVFDLNPVERGQSGRIIALKIIGEKRSLTIGKELEIRRALSRSHLYSSAFVVRKEKHGAGKDRFRFIGAGWGHGVGLCQIGAAVMADGGIAYRDILSHYFKGASTVSIY